MNSSPYHTLTLSLGGTLEVNSESLLIKDKKMRWSYRIMHFTSILWVPLSLIFMFKEGFDPDSFLVWAFAIICVAQLIVSLFLFRLSWQERVMLDEVKSAKVKTGLNNANLILHLKNGKQRRIHADYDQASALRNLAGAKLAV